MESTLDLHPAWQEEIFLDMFIFRRILKKMFYEFEGVTNT